jgi:DNA polymerase-3 subunit epsilon
MNMNERDGKAVANTPSVDIDQLARQVSQHPDYRVLTRIAEPFASGANKLPLGARRLAIIDCETTGLDRRCDTIIELAVMMVIVDADGRIVAHEKPVAWLEDAEFGLDPKVVHVTGITEEMIAGQCVDREGPCH